RAMPLYFLPYVFFALITPKALQTFLSASASSGKGSLYFCLNFSCAAGVSPEMPSTVTPAFCILLYASRNPHASMVQPGVSALGKKNSTTLLPRKSFRDTFWPFWPGKVNSGALSLICMADAPSDRSTLYRKLRRAVTVASLALAVTQLSPGQASRRGTVDKGPRALGLIELAANGKAHLIPITIMHDGRFYDAGA